MGSEMCIRDRDLGAYERGDYGAAIEARPIDRSARSSAEESSGSTPASEPPPTSSPDASSAAERRQNRAQARAATRPLRREIERLEVEMEALNEEIAALDEKLADSATYTENSDTLNSLLAEQGQARARLAAVEQSLSLIHI